MAKISIDPPVRVEWPDGKVGFAFEMDDATGEVFVTLMDGRKIVIDGAALAMPESDAE